MFPSTIPSLTEMDLDVGSDKKHKIASHLILVKAYPRLKAPLLSLRKKAIAVSKKP